MTVPSIPPIDAQDRPRWSVMIPAWNAASFLAVTLESVLSADLPPGSEIEVVDDCSTDATPDIAASFENRGVSYFRHDSQQGAPANFNACLTRSRGELVHVLHADDEIVAGFYTAAEAALTKTEAVAAVCRTQYIDDVGAATLVTRSESATGIWHSALDVLAVSNRVRPPGIAVRRDAYEAIGGFDEELPHAADWEMWVRLAEHGPLWFEDRILARYRVHEDQDTTAKVLDASNIAERVVALEMINQRLPAGNRHLRKGLLYTSVFAARSSLRLARRRRWSASTAQLLAAGRAALAGATGLTSLARRVDT